MSMIDNLLARLERGQDDPMLRFGLGSAYFNEGSFQLAEEHLVACLDQNPDYTAAYKLLGKAQLKQDKQDAARKTFEAGLPVAEKAGDKQTIREIGVFLNKLKKNTRT